MAAQPWSPQVDPMLLMSLGLALAMLTDTAAAPTPAPAPPPPETPAAAVKRPYGPPAPAKTKRKPVHSAAVSGDKSCADARQRIEDQTTILVCGSPSDEYRLDPDLLRAEERRRIARHGSPPRPSGAMPDTGICERSGGCRALEAISWVNVAMVVGQMAAKAAKGESVADVFVTNPSPTEYEFYQDSKKRREANELDAAASAAAARAREAKAAKSAKAAQAAAAVDPAPPAPPEQ